MMMAEMGKIDQMQSAVDRAANKICEYIATGRFVAGQRLPETDLVEQIGVSKTVLREAFAKLQQDGIVELQKYRGASVRRLSLEKVTEILATNTVLMAWAAHEAASHVAKSPDDNRASLGAIRHRLQTLAPYDQRDHLAVFYDAVDVIITLAGNAYLQELIRRSFNPLVREFLLDSIDFKPEVIDHTRKLDVVFDLIEGGHAEAAFDAMRTWSRLDRSWIHRSLEPGVAD